MNMDNFNSNYKNKKENKAKIIELTIVAVFAFLLIEVLCGFIMGRPLIILSHDISGEQDVYKGLFYNTYSCYKGDSVKLKTKFTKFTCSISSVEGRELYGTITNVSDNYLTLKLEDSKESLKISLENNPTIIGAYGVYEGQYILIELLDELTKNTKSVSIDEINVIENNGKDYSNMAFIIVDNVSSCPQSLEKIHNDGMYEYYLPCIKSSNVYIKFSNGDKVPIKAALARGYVTAQDLLDKGYNLLKQEISKDRGNFTIIDVTGACAQALEKIYEDENYNYFLSCIKSSTVYVRFNNGETFTMKEALNQKYITPEQVIKKKYNLIKEAKKKERNDFNIIDDVESCASAIEEVYRDDKYVYTLSCIKSESVIVEFDNGERYSLKEALNKKYVTPAQVINKGYPLGKKPLARGDFKVVDNAGTCAQSLEEIYRDKTYIYYLSCQKSNSVFIEFDNGEKYPIKEALENGLVTPDQIINKGYKLTKKKIARGDFTIIDNAGSCAQSLEEIYRDKTYKYYLSCQKSSKVFVKFENGEKYTMKVALSKGYITPDQVIKKKYNLIKKPIARGNFKIIDEVEGCASAIEEVYRDSMYKYTLSCVKSGAVIVEFDNGEKYSLKVALNKKYITPDQVIKKGYPLSKIPLARGDFKIIDNVQGCASAIEEVYRDSKYKYTLSCIKSGSVIVEFDNGERYSLKEALNKKYITPDQVINKGYPLGKSPIVVGRGDFRIIDEVEGCASVIEDVYVEGNMTCYFSCSKSGAVFIEFENGEKYTIKEALNKKYVTPAQIAEKGYTDLKCSSK